MYPKIRQFVSAEWAFELANFIQQTINAVLTERGECSVMLTGGRSVVRLYLAWAELPDFRKMRGVRFFFGDERCVPPDHKESNFGMVMKTLFVQGIPAGCQIIRMEADILDSSMSAMQYDVILPESIDILLLSVGDDGHIASIFPGSSVLEEVSRKVLFVSCPKPSSERLTITPLVITKAASVIVLAFGVVKARVLAQLMQSEEAAAFLPAALVMSAAWLLDSELQNLVLE